MSEELLQEALRLADLGFQVFPCTPGEKVPATPHGCKDATSDEARITGWWTATPDANIGIASAGLVVIDLDAGPNGEPNQWLSDQPERMLELSGGAVTVTPRGGRHLYLRCPAGVEVRNSASKVAPGVDVRAAGGYVLAPPSIVGGKTYRWAEGNALECRLDQLPAPPAWLLAMLTQTAGTSVRLAEGTDAEPEGAIPEGQRDSTLTSIAGSLRRPGLSRAALAAALHVVNRQRCKPPLADAEVERIAWSVSRYAPDAVATMLAENPPIDFAAEPVAADPGPTPAKLLSAPGFIDNVKDFILRTAPYPEPALAFAGALALQSFLASRKVCDGNTRSNLYLIALAHSGAGKEWPRSVIKNVLRSCGLGDSYADSMASAEGLEDALLTKPAYILLADEIAQLFAAMKNGRGDEKYERIAKILLTLFTSSDTVYAMRLKAGKHREEINQPGLTLHGSAIPKQLYGSLSPAVLTNGLFARLLVIEAGNRGRGRASIQAELPSEIMMVANHWAAYQRDGGNLTAINPSPTIIKRTAEAAAIFADFQADSDRQYDEVERNGDDSAMAVWARNVEKSARLALNFACSADYRNPIINRDSAVRACNLAQYLTRRMLFMAGLHVSESPFHAECQKVERFIRSWQAEHEGKPAPIGKIKRLLRGLDNRGVDNVIAAMASQGTITLREIGTGTSGGRPTLGYVSVSA